MPKHIEFDADRFLKDVERELKRRGRGALWTMCLRCGLNQPAVSNALRHRRLRDIETILSIASYLGLHTFDYRHKHKLLPHETVRRMKAAHRSDRAWARDRIDWKLFRACVSLFCGNDVEQLIARTKLSRRLALRVLRFGSCKELTFAFLCNRMGVRADAFEKGWTVRRAVDEPDALAA